MMKHSKDDLLTISAQDVVDILRGKESAVIELMRISYEAHALHRTEIPHSVFLRFPDNQKDRIIGLPAYIAHPKPVAGIKWVASFPDNIRRGQPRASALLILNSMQDGRPYCLLEASHINTIRTAASASLAATIMSNETARIITLVGCGPVNQHVCHFLLSAFNTIKKINMYDVDRARATSLAQAVQSSTNLEIAVYDNLQQACQEASIVSIATSATSPHITNSTIFAPGTVVLNISLRDLSPEIITQAVNVVDDIEHVNRKQTSIHLAAQQTGNVDFINATIGDLLIGSKLLKSSGALRIFSPFGLGVLDISLGEYIYQQARLGNFGHMVGDFFARDESIQV